MPLILLACAPSLLGRRAEGQLLVACGAAAIAWVFLQGWAIGLPGTVWSIAAPFVGADATQPALGWGATFLLAGAVGLLAAGLAARGRFGGDAFVAFLVTGSAALLLMFVFAPLLTILSAAAVEDGEIAPGAMVGRLTAPEAWSLACVTSSLGCGVVWNTLALATLTGVLSTLLGLAFALLAARANLRLSGAFRALAILPLITPPFVVSLSLIVLFGRTGMVTEALSALLGIPRSRWIYGMPGVLIAQLLAFTPIAFMLLEGAVRQIAPSLEEAASTMGARRFTVFRTVTWPLLRPGLAAAFLLGFVESLSDFGNPLVLGGDFDVLATRIFFAIAGARHDPGRAAALALLLLGLTFGAFALQTAWLGKRRYVAESEVHALSGDGMHAVRRVTNERKAWSDVGACEVRCERPGLARTCEREGAEAAGDARFDFREEACVVECEDALGFGGVFRPSEARPIVRERQNGEGTRRQEVLDGAAFVRAFVRDGCDDGRLAMFPADGLDARAIARRRAAALCADEELGREFASIVQRDGDAGAVVGEVCDAGRRDDVDTRCRGDSCGECAFECGCGYDVACGFTRGSRLAGLQVIVVGQQDRADPSIEARIRNLDFGDGLRDGREILPDAKRLQHTPRPGGKREGACVIRRGRRRDARRLEVHDGDADLVSESRDQCARQGKAGEARAGNDDVITCCGCCVGHGVGHALIGVWW